MRSLRTTLTLWYTAALAVAVVAFGIIVTVLQRRAGEQATAERVNGLSSRVVDTLEARARDGRGPLVDITFSPRVVRLRADVEDQLALLPGMVLVMDTTRAGAYGSAEVTRLSTQAKDTLRGRLAAMQGESERFSITLDREEYRFVARKVRSAGRIIVSVAVGEPAPEPVVAVQRFASWFALIVPIIVAVASIVGYLVAGRALGAVGRMIDDVEAISDGRTLHRRLLAPASGEDVDEIGRLANALNRLLARLEASFSALRRFTADASHELKTPLTVMRAGVERALTQQQMPPEAMQPLEDTLQGVQHMTELVESLLTLARVDEGRMELHREPVDLGDVMAEVHETAQILGEEAGLDVTLERPAGEPVVVAGDRARLRQLVMNLATNAVKYTPNGGAVGLILTQTPSSATISVRDTGIGIAPGDVARVFERFWRADVARSRTGERAGFGLGLSIARWIAEAHGGSIAVTSRPGRGSTFTVTLPRTQAAVMES